MQQRLHSRLKGHLPTWLSTDEVNCCSAQTDTPTTALQTNTSSAIQPSSQPANQPVQSSPSAGVGVGVGVQHTLAWWQRAGGVGGMAFQRKLRVVNLSGKIN